MRRAREVKGAADEAAQADARLTSRQRELRDMYGIEPEAGPKK